MTNRHRKHLKETEWKQIKALLNAEIKQSKVQEVTNRSSWTVNMIKKSTSFSNFRELTTDFHKKYSPKGKIVIGTGEDENFDIKLTLLRIESKLDKMAERKGLIW